MAKLLPDETQTSGKTDVFKRMLKGSSSFSVVMSLPVGYNCKNFIDVSLNNMNECLTAEECVEKLKSTLSIAYEHEKVLKSRCNSIMVKEFISFLESFKIEDGKLLLNICTI